MLKAVVAGAAESKTLSLVFTEFDYFKSGQI